MDRYFFIFGTHPSLSAAELISFFEQRRLSYTIEYAGADFMVVATPPGHVLPWERFLGGIVKWGRIMGRSETFSSDDFLTILRPYIPQSGRLYYGFSYYPQGAAEKRRSWLQRTGIELKRSLQSIGCSPRFVTARSYNLSSVVVAKNKLLSPQGAELVLLAAGSMLYLGRTEAVQAFAALSRRDYSRPARDDHSGMLPPKLAQMMIHLSRSSTAGMLLDPFCGSGTVIQEALLLGYHQVIGSDISEKAIADSRRNIDWLNREMNERFSPRFITSDVRKLDKAISPGSVAAIVSEPDLGDPRLSSNRIRVECRRLEDLYVGAYQVFGRLLRTGSRVVMVWPVFYRTHFLDIEQAVAQAGFKKIKPLPLSVMNTYRLNERDNLYYGRSQQKITREITVWQRV